MGGFEGIIGGASQLMSLGSQAMGMFGGGGGGSIDFDAREYANQANGMLDKALTNAIQYTEQYTDKAADLAKQGDEVSQARNAPYRLASYNALDKYMESMGLARPEMGAYKLANALERDATRQAAIDELTKAAREVRDIDTSGIVPDWQGHTNPTPDAWSGNSIEGTMTEAERIAHAARNVMRHNNGINPYGSTYGPYMQAVGQMTAANPGGLLVDDAAAYLQAMDKIGSATLREGRWYGGGVIPYTLESQPEKSVVGIRDMIRKSQDALADYRADTRFWTPEMSSIAKGFNQGLLTPAKWVEVGGAGYYA